MRITNQILHRQNLTNYQAGSKSVYDLQEKLSSRLKINQPYEDTGIYVDATRLDYELTILDQVKEATTKASEFAKNTDNTLNSFVEKLTDFKTKLIQAANEGVHSVTSRVAIANDLQAFRDALVDIANTAINGQYLFSGTAIDIKPISSDGKYHGNDKNIQVLSGTSQLVTYNIDGQNLFLGRDNDYKKQISTNITLINQHEELNDASPETFIKATDSIYQLIGTGYQTDALNQQRPMDYVDDFGVDDIKALPPTIFFMQGQKPDGESFSVKFELSAGASMQDLMDQMGKAMGNDGSNKVVEVSLNKNSQIQMTNLQNGNEIMSFSIFGLTAMQGVAGENPISTDRIRTLSNKNDIASAIEDNRVRLTSFISSPNYNDINGEKSTTFAYDNLYFEKSGSTITSNVSQIVRKDNSFATDSTKLKEVLASEQGKSLKDAEDLSLNITAKDGTKYVARIQFNGSTNDKGEACPTILIREENGNVFYSGNFYKTEWNDSIDPNDPTKQIGDEVKVVTTDDLTFKEINDLIAVIANGNLNDLQNKNYLVAGADIQTAYNEFNETLKNASRNVSASMDNRGHIVVQDLTTSVSKIEVAIYQDRKGNDYPVLNGADGFVSQNSGTLSFHKNDAVIIDRPSVNLFADLDDMIQSVRDGSFFGNPNGNNPRTAGVQGAIERLDHLMDHVNKQHAIAGSNSRLVTDTFERASTLAVNISSVKSDVIDVDYGEVMMQLSNRLLAYQAMLQATAKVSSLSLLNYM